MAASSMEKIVSLSKRRGFIFQTSAVYGGLSSSWDYGPLGVELKNNLKRIWWQSVVYEREDIEGLDSAILMNRLVWKYSGHETTFSDPLVDCKACKTRSRADHIPDNKCPKCGSKDLTEPRQFNLMFKTHIGPVESDDQKTYLRPETAQGIFMNFSHVQQTQRRKLPFGIAQIGKAFRNEITPGNFTFRTREFEQMEIEYFCKPPQYLAPGEKSDEQIHKDWVDFRYQFYIRYGIAEQRLRKREQQKEELAHYAKATIDLEYCFPGSLGFSEIEGIANRQDFDLSAHSREIDEPSMKRLHLSANIDSVQTLDYYDDAFIDPQTGQKGAKYIPYVIEPSAGADRATLAFLCEAYHEEWVQTLPTDEFNAIKTALDAAMLSLQKRLKELSFKKELTSVLAEQQACWTKAVNLLSKAQNGPLDLLFEVDEICSLPLLAPIEAIKKLQLLLQKNIENFSRTVLKLHPQLAPIKAAIFPLKKNDPKLVSVAKNIRSLLAPSMKVVYDDTASIGKLYRRQDEIGTPFCITVDYQSLEDKTITIRNRDTMQQERIALDDLPNYLLRGLSHF